MASTSNTTDYLAYGDKDVETTQVGTLSRSTWLAQAAELPEDKKPSPPSPFNIILAFISCLTCPLLGWLSIIFAIQARVEYNHKHYNEAAALCTRAQGTSLYSIAIGICLALGYGVLVGAGITLNWYD